MDGMNRDELNELRKRAYGPDSDIHIDPEALQRLRELEDGAAQRDAGPAAVEPSPEPVHAPAQPGEQVESANPNPRSDLLQRISQVRRSTVLIALGFAAIAGVIAASFILVQRVQSDPLQVGAEQVARLTVDPDYQIPRFFYSDRQAFREFYGLRVVVTGGGTVDRCLNIYADADITDPSSSSFTGGALRGGCAAGSFPAMTQFRVDALSLPDELRTAFATSQALQFVYDDVNNEVVVFSE